MNRHISLLLLINLFYPGTLLSQAQGFINLNDRQFKDVNGDDFYPLILNTRMDLIFPGGSPEGTPLLTYSLQYDESEGLDCYNQEECDADLLNQFKRIKSMGFNCIRVMGLSPRFATRYHSQFTSRKFTGFTVAAQTNNPWNEYFIPMQLPYSSSPQSEFLIRQYEKLLQLANRVPQPFYIIFNMMNFYNQDVKSHKPYDIRVISPYYAEFLSEVSSRLCAYPNLLAYDLFNEPIYFEQMALEKEEVLQMVELWSNSIKQNCNHLITLNNVWNDVNEWGQAGMKIDFYSVHFYPERSEQILTAEEALQISLEKFRCMSLWYMQNCAMPWIIGETGFSCLAGSEYPVVNGDMTQQETWASETLEISRNCGASGYSWWLDQETCWNAYEDGLGLMYHGKSFTSAPSRHSEKDAVQVFRKYLKKNQAPPRIQPDSPPASYDGLLKCE